MFKRPFLVAGSALLAASLAHAGGDQKPFELMVGDPAPAIEVREWVQGDPIASFEPGQVYVVEFWATWCGPCRRIIPHMSELAAEYGEEVEFVGVSIWESLSEDRPYAVPAFVEEMGEEMSYTVASDRTAAGQEPVMAKTWMEAAGQNGIPAAFIVDGSGRVAWIGSPFTIDEPLAKIVAGEWDVDAAAKEHAREMATEAAALAVRDAIREAVVSGSWDAAAAALERALEEHPSLERTLGAERYKVLVAAGDEEKAAEYGRHLVEKVLAGDPMRLNALAWGIVDPASRREGADAELAKLAAHRANELTEWKDAALLDTYAVALFLTGAEAKAIEVQEKAVELAAGTPLEAEVKERLEEFRRSRSTPGGSPRR